MKRHFTTRQLPLVLCCLLTGLVGCAPQQPAASPAEMNAPGAANTPGSETTTSVPGEVWEVQMTAADMRFEPSTLTVQPGQKVRVSLTNKGEAPHNVEFELPEGEKEFEENLAPGETKTLEFTAPEKPGEYTFYCPVGNHRERGMTGTLTVAETGGS